MLLSPEVKAAWVVFRVASRRMEIRISDRMASQGIIDLGLYEVLLMLEEAHEGRLRLGELAERIGLSPSGATRLCDRLEAEGLVRRVRSDDDRRAIFAEITPEGAKRRAEAWPLYQRALEEMFAPHMRKTDARLLSRILRPLCGEERLIGITDQTPSVIP